MGKNIPLRQCAGCREKKPKQELIRIIRTPEKEVILDRDGRKNGRGVYLCPSPECLKKVRKSRALARALKTEIPEEIYDRLDKELNGLETDR